jgi:GH3 auxin-responsive promoter
MGLKSALSKPFAAIVNRRLNKLRTNAVPLQQKTFTYLISQAKNTAFGKTHHFDEIKTYADFK